MFWDFDRIWFWGNSQHTNRSTFNTSTDHSIQVPRHQHIRIKFTSTHQQSASTSNTFSTIGTPTRKHSNTSTKTTAATIMNHNRCHTSLCWGWCVDDSKNSHRFVVFLRWCWRCQWCNSFVRKVFDLSYFFWIRLSEKFRVCRICFSDRKHQLCQHSLVELQSTVVQQGLEGRTWNENNNDSD